MNSSNKEEEVSQFLAGEKLYGDNFSAEQIGEWYREEEEAYADLGSKERDKYAYEYDAQNNHFAFRHLGKGRRFKHALGFGSAYGHEFLPIVDRIEKITIVEPSDKLRSEKLGNITPVYKKPQDNGRLGFGDGEFDLILCFSVLHHIPNVSLVVSELLRVLAPGGVLLVKEPIRSMGDWRRPRAGLTKNERGIPLKIFDGLWHKPDIVIKRRTLFDCAFAYKPLRGIFGLNINSGWYQYLDHSLAKLTQWNVRYTPRNAWEKIAPASAYYVIEKR